MCTCEPETSGTSTPSRPIGVVFVLVAIAFVSPFATVLGTGILQAAGALGMVMAGGAVLLLPFFPKRHGFRIYDSLAILIFLALAASQAPSFIRAAPPRDAQGEQQTVAIANALLKHVEQYGVEGLPEFFSKQLGDAPLETTSLGDGENSYTVNTEMYCYTLFVQNAKEPHKARFSFTALAAPTTDGQSIFVDNSGEIISFETSAGLQ